MSSGPIELATAYVSLAVSAKGVGKDILKETSGIGAAFGKAGQQGGAAFSSAFSKSSAGATKAAVADQAALEKAVQSAVGKVKTARDAEAAAARKVAIEETKLKEARGSGAKESQILAIEDRLAGARTKQALATAKTTIEVDKLKGAQRELKSASEQAEQGVTKSAGRLRTAFDKINPFAGMKAKAKKEGEDAGDEFGSSMEQAAKKGQGRLGKAGVAIGTAVGGGLLQVANKVGGAFVDTVTGSISGASKLEQSIGGIGAVFGKDVDQIDKAARGAATSIGMSRNAYNELATTVGAGLKNKGIKDYAGETQRLLGLGGDLAAQFGGSTQEAVEALSSLMRGEADPIERYGVSINETAVNAELAARGQDKLTGAALESAKAQARLDLVFRQTADAQGAFARESNTFAGVQARAAAQWENLQAKIGTAFLPVLTQAMGFVANTAIPALESFGGWISRVWKGEGEGTSWFSTLAVQVAPVVAAFKDLASVYAAQLMPVLQSVGALFSTVILPALASLWQSIQANVVPAFTVLVGKVGEVVQVIGSVLGPIIQTIVAKFQELSPQINAAMTQLGQIIGGVMELISTLIGAALDVIRKLWSLWGDNILALVRIVMDTIMGVIRGVMNIIQGVINVVMGVITGDWSRAWDGIKQIFQGIWQVIVSILSGAVKAVWEIIKAGFDIVRGIFQNVADFLTGLWEGLWNGIKNFLVTTTQAIWGAIQGWWNQVKTGFSAFGAFVSGLWGGLWNGLKAVGDSVMASIKGAIDLGLNAVKGFFSSAVEGIRTIWAGLQKAASDPVRFVIDTVINNGIIKGWNDVVGLLKLDNLKIAPISVPGFWRGGRADVLPGHAPGRGDNMLVVDKYGQARASIRSGEGIVREGAMQSLDRFHPGAFEYINRTGTLPGFFQGGRLPGYADGGVINFRGHRFTQEFANRIVSAERMVGRQMQITQGGWRPATSYSGTSHAGDALDIAGGGFRDFITALRRVGIAARDRTGKGNWIPHVHGVPLPGAGIARGSATWQAQDYLAGGDGLGGRDNGPRVAADGTIIAGASDGGGLFDMAGQWITDKLASPVRAMLDRIPGAGLFLDLAKGVGTKLLDAAVGKLKGLIPAIGGDSGSSSMSGHDEGTLQNPGPNATRWAPLVARALAHSGIGGGQEDVAKWVRQIWSESKGDPQLIQSSALRDINVRRGDPARGLVQVPGVTWADFGKDMGPFLPNVYDPFKNLVVGMRAASRQHRDWRRVIGFGHGYWTGTDSATPGWHLVGERGPELVNFRGGEQVATAPTSREVLGSMGMPSELVIRDVDGALIGRMRVEAQSALADSYARVGGR